MENKTLKEFALMCECAQKVAEFGILADFLKKAVTDFYSYKSKNEVLQPEELEIFKMKYHELEDLIQKMV